MVGVSPNVPLSSLGDASSPKINTKAFNVLIRIRDVYLFSQWSQTHHIFNKRYVLNWAMCHDAAAHHENVSKIRPSLTKKLRPIIRWALKCPPEGRGAICESGSLVLHVHTLTDASAEVTKPPPTAMCHSLRHSATHTHARTQLLTHSWTFVQLVRQ